MTERDDPPSLGDIVSAAGLTVALVTAWLYVAGWTYAYAYFQNFHIPLLMLDIPVEHMLSYGGLVVIKTPWSAVVILLLVLAALLALMRFAARLGRFGTSALLVGLVLLLFGLAHLGGRGVAGADVAWIRGTDYAAYPRVRLSWTGTDIPPATVVSEILKTDCGRLLAVSKERLFVIRPVRDAPQLDLHTIVVASAKVQAMLVHADDRSCW